uniref:Uncharacterized protein n=1 Tax=candidate division CPR3 bacterium TaxID=2268181 RepID=A0A7C4QXS3_UNCC3
MKKLVTATLFLIAISFASISAMACSSGQISAEKTEVKIALDPNSSRAIMTVVAKDEAGEVLCSLEQMNFGTSRNNWAPSNGWIPNVDKINVHARGGKALVIFKTKEPAGTTVYAQVNGVKVGNTDGMPFSYNQF